MNSIITRTITELVENEHESPLPISVIPNYMGINLCSVDSITWEKQSDGQLLYLRVNFIPVAECEE